MLHTFISTNTALSVYSVYCKCEYCMYSDLMSPAAMNTGSLLSRLVMLSTENWLMLSQLLV